MLRKSREGRRAELDQDMTEYLGGKLAELGSTFGETSLLFRQLKDKESGRDRWLKGSATTSPLSAILCQVQKQWAGGHLMLKKTLKTFKPGVKSYGDDFIRVGLMSS